MKKKPIFQKILIPLMGLVILEILILAGSLFGQDLFGELLNNEMAIVDENVRGRAEYLNNIMVNSWMNLEYTVNSVNAVTQELVDEGTISLDTLDDSSSSSVPLLNEVSDLLISMMRSNRVSGAFLILNTDEAENLRKAGYPEKPGIYLRDQDPTSQYYSDNQDLLILRAPISMVRQLGIPADSFWELNFSFEEGNTSCEDLFYRTIEVAEQNKNTLSWQNQGHWSEPYELFDKKETVIAYTVPLILKDGSVYGVLGVDISLDYFASLFPYQEIADDSQGSYFIGKKTSEDHTYTCVFGDGNLQLDKAYTEAGVYLNPEYYYGHEIRLDIYNSNTPYYSDQWIFGGVVPVEKLNAFAVDMSVSVLIAVLVTFAVGAGGSLIISYRIQKPVALLSKEMQAQDPRKQISLKDTGIREIDQMSREVEKLSRDVIEGDMKLTKIIRMASANLAGFQIDLEKNSLFVTEHFFDIFGRPEIDERELTVEQFQQIMEELHLYFLEKNELTDSYIYLLKENGEERYVQLKYLEDHHNIYGLCEDITQTALEKRVLQHERDHDLLTDLYNRRAFWRKLQKLFRNGKSAMKIGALIMLDLDNLKHINDTYGHEYGDRYIMQMGNVLRQYLPRKALYARISGDEFYVFLYGCEKREEIEEQILNLKQGLKYTYVELPGYRKQNIQASGGVAWYPQDSTLMEELFKFADYAMYEVKRSVRGDIRDFNREDYEKQDELNRSKYALNSLIENRSVQYAFQPIVDAHTGKIYAYEALMRPYMSELKNVQEILETARREGKLREIEELTWFEAMDTFNNHVEEGRIQPGTYLFLNSIPNQRLSQRQEELLAEKYGEYMHFVVLEMTEEERIDKVKWEGKQIRHRQMGGMIAMDDYGTGYNSEKMLLTISPEFIKVDMAIIKGIHLSADKQAMVSYIVNYAHERNKFIIAEGVEGEEEARMVISLGADFLQGYFLGKPQVIPEGVSVEALRVIREMQEERT